MFDLYVISILDSIVGVSVVFALIGFAATVTFAICKSCNAGLDTNNSYDEEKIKQNNTAIRICKPFIYVGIAALLISVFTPSTKQGYMIYGIGNTIEYLQGNEKAKQLPDKAIDAIDRYLDEVAKEKQNKDSNSSN